MPDWVLENTKIHLIVSDCSKRYKECKSTWPEKKASARSHHGGITAMRICVDMWISMVRTKSEITCLCL